MPCGLKSLKMQKEKKTQSAFLTIECRDEKKYFDLKELLQQLNFYGYREVQMFPWMQSYHYEDTIVDIKYQ